MKALVFENIRTPVVKDVPIPDIGPHDVLIRVKAAGICGTDVHIYEGEYFSEFPLIAGHEFSGVVEDIGEEVSTFAVGDRVTADPNIGCGKCYFCKINQQNQCKNLGAVGVTRDGAFAEYVVVPEEKVFNIGNMGFQDAAMIEPTLPNTSRAKRAALPDASPHLRERIWQPLPKNSSCCRSNG